MTAPAGHPRDPGFQLGAPWPRLPGWFLALGAFLILAAGLGGWMVSRATAPAPAPAAFRAVDVGPVSLTAPGAWSVARGPVAGLPATAAPVTTLAPIPGLDARVVVIVAGSDDATLVPEELRAFVGAGSPRRSSLAGLPAWTYRRRAVAKARVAQVTVAPTTAGSLTVLCVAPAAAWAGADDCAGDLSSASLRGASPLVPSPTLAFRRRLAPVTERVGTRRTELRAKLRQAATRRGQARFARRLGRVHAGAVSALAPLAPEDGAPRRVVRELRRIARGYGRLAAAAQAGWPERYRSARLGLQRSDRALAAALKDVR